MAYMHIENLYANQDILQFRECYALEKIHGTSAHVAWRDSQLSLFSGGMNHAAFVKLFDQEKLKEGFEALGQTTVTVFGEAYGGKCQGMSRLYGPNLRFVAFEVKIGDSWLSVPQAEDIVHNLGLEFIFYRKVPTDLDTLNSLQVRPSVQSWRNGVRSGEAWEGVVLRPLMEVTKNNGARIIAKHKNPAFSETTMPREVDPGKVQAMQEVAAIVQEWVTENRLANVLSHFPEDVNITSTGDIVRAMIEDIEREGAQEFTMTPELRKQIGRASAEMFKRRLALT